MSKRTRYNSINECCSHMEQLRLHANISHCPIIESPDMKVDSIYSKIEQVELSIANRLDTIDNNIKNVESKLDKLVNLILTMSDTHYKIHPSYVI